MSSLSLHQLTETQLSPRLLKTLENTPIKFKTVLIANRSEIAIRIARTCHEMGLRTISIYSYQDRYSMHRYKADESWQIGEIDQYTAVGAYLAQDEIIGIAKRRGAEAIAVGYGLLSENAAFAKKVRAAGLIFIGPPTSILAALGDKVRARHLATRKCGVATIPGSDALKDYTELKAFIDVHGLPVVLKASQGGGGRGIRFIRKADDLESTFNMCRSEALNAFGDGTLFVERLIEHAKHIEVQLMADSSNAIPGQSESEDLEVRLDGDSTSVIHLFERDCSVQRRHQKVVEIAPTPPGQLHPDLREKILKDAVKIARMSGYVNIGTAEFLVENSSSKDGKYYFIEINPRVQVEHVVTEQILGVDLIAAQIGIAAGATLQELGFVQEELKCRGYAMQCRITTEDPTQNFTPDAGKISLYRSAGGCGVRLDGHAYQGSVITPHYDSLLVKCTASGSTFDVARRKMLRALMEFRVRGVKTNIQFLGILLQSDIFCAGEIYTTHLDEELPKYIEQVKHVTMALSGQSTRDRGHKLLQYLGDMFVNGSQIKGQVGEPGLREHDPILPELPDDMPKTWLKEPLQAEEGGWRYIYLREGPEAFAHAVRNHPTPLIMDTTMRDAHQSLLATRMRTYDMARIAPLTSHLLKHAYSLENWGGATFDVSLNFLHECPWDRLRTLRKLIPNIPFQMLIRGANGVAYSAVPDNVVYDFCKKAKDEGIDVFRIFDSLNYLENLELGIKAVRAAGGIIEAAICYTGDVARATESGSGRYDLKYYLSLVDTLVNKSKIHVLGIKDMAGLLTPRSAKLLISAIREAYPDLPIHVHMHDTAGNGVATMLAAVEAGADVIDTAMDSLSGVTSQPCCGALVSSLQGTPLDLGVKFEDVQLLNAYWEQVRLLYECFDPKINAPASEVLNHQIPGGQYSNLLFQARANGLGQQWTQLKHAYVESNRLLGDITKVTPSSKVCGDLSNFMVANGLTEKDVLARAASLDFPRSVVEYFQGYLGQPSYGFPEPFRTQVLRGKAPLKGRPGASLPALDFDKLKQDLEAKYGQMRDVDLSSAAQYPAVFDEFMKIRERYGNLSILPTRFFLSPMKLSEEVQVSMEEGKDLIIKLLAVSQANSNGEKELFFSLNGETRVITVKDSTSKVTLKTRLKADAANKNEVGAPMSGVVVDCRCKIGAKVKVGDPLFVISAMKMETNVTATASGVVESIHVSVNDSLAVGDLLCKIKTE